MAHVPRGVQVRVRNTIYNMEAAIEANITSIPQLCVKSACTFRMWLCCGQTFSLTERHATSGHTKDHGHSGTRPASKGENEDGRRHLLTYNMDTEKSTR